MKHITVYRISYSLFKIWNPSSTKLPQYTKRNLSISPIFINLLSRLISGGYLLNGWNYLIRIFLDIQRKKTHTQLANPIQKLDNDCFMIALLDVHISHGGLTSHVSQSLRSQIPSSNLSMRWMSVILPHRVHARSLALWLTNPCFNCPITIDIMTTLQSYLNKSYATASASW